MSGSLFCRLCLSITDFHPDTWNPAWSVSTILTGLLSFMVEKGPTLGSIETSDFTVRGGERGHVSGAPQTLCGDSLLWGSLFSSAVGRTGQASSGAWGQGAEGAAVQPRPWIARDLVLVTWFLFFCF